MATPAPTADAASRSRVYGRARLITFLALLILLAVCLVFSWVTRGAMANLAFLRAQKGTARASLVDLSPWQTAQTLASLAVTAEEQDYARQAEHLADHEVDQAFAAALRTADLEARGRVLSGPALVLSQRVSQFQQQMAEDQARVDQLKAKGAGQRAVPAAPASQALQVAQAQLALDADELSDAEHDLNRATGNATARLQNELAAHEAAMSKATAQQENGGPIAVVSVRSHGTLAGRIAA